jgi:hypothetical protein
MNAITEREIATFEPRPMPGGTLIFSMSGGSLPFQLSGTVEAATGDDLLRARQRIDALRDFMRGEGDEVRCTVAVRW